MKDGDARLRPIDYSLLATLTSDRPAWPQAGRNGLGGGYRQREENRLASLWSNIWPVRLRALQSELAAVICIEVAKRQSPLLVAPVAAGGRRLI
jgi:hypothetical protein